MTSERIDKAIEIINYAIKNHISVREASTKFGFANTYVKNVKAIVFDLYNSDALSFHLFSKFYDAYHQYETAREEDSTFQAILNENEASIKENKKPKDLPSTNTDESTTFSVSDDGKEATADWVSGTNYPPDHIKTLEELLEATEVDLDVWKVTSHSVNKWDVTIISKTTGLPITIQNYQVKARLERKVEEIRERLIGELFQEMVENYEAPKLSVTPKSFSSDENNLFELTLFDLHLGKLAWGGETGENFDTKIARQRFLVTIEKLIQRASSFEYNRILFPVGNDFFNSDTILNTTTKGTPQDEDLRWQKTFKVGTTLLVDAINLLKQTGVPVDVVNIQGNHDFERSFYMGEFLAAWFRNDPMVNVNNGASPRKYYKFGKVLLGLTHGSEEKEGSLPMLMASDIESKPMWSETLFHEFHVGHIHRKRDIKYTILDKEKMTSEDLGVTVRYLSSLTGTEEWHHKKGFVGSLKAGEGFIWNDETGLIAHLNANFVVE